MEVPYWVNFLLWGSIIIVGFVLLFLFNAWSLNRKVKDKKTGRNKMLVEIQGADGFPTRHLVAIDANGKTVTVNKGIYRLSEKRKTEPEGGGKVSSFPVLRFDKYPKVSFMGIGSQKILRLESFQEGNPEPIKPFYGKFVDAEGKACDPEDEGARFVGSRLMVTSIEIVALINEAHAAEASIEIEELKAREKTFQTMLGNLPNKAILYIGLAACIIMSGVGLVVVWGLKSAMGY